MSEFEGVEESNIAHELLESWVNGNRKWVMDELLKLSTAQAALVFGHMVHEIHEGRVGTTGRDEKVRDLISMLGRRL